MNFNLTDTQMRAIEDRANAILNLVGEVDSRDSIYAAADVLALLRTLERERLLRNEMEQRVTKLAGLATLAESFKHEKMPSNDECSISECRCGRTWPCIDRF